MGSTKPLRMAMEACYNFIGQNLKQQTGSSMIGVYCSMQAAISS